MSVYQRKKVLVTAKAYPTPASKGAEVSCTAGITDDGKWIRLFPIPFRYMDGNQQFKKYEWIGVDAKKSSDPRKESYEVDVNSLNVVSKPLSTDKEWKAHKEIIFPLLSPSLCHLKKWRKQTGDTLGIFKPRIIHKFVIERVTPYWAPDELEKLMQPLLYEKRPFKPLEKIPYRFSYEFTCSEPSCTGHKLMCVDWELCQAYRSWKQKYGDNWKWAIENKFETEMVFKYDTHFFVGTIHGHPNVWIIIGLFYPPIPKNIGAL